MTAKEEKREPPVAGRGGMSSGAGQTGLAAAGWPEMEEGVEGESAEAEDTVEELPLRKLTGIDQKSVRKVRLIRNSFKGGVAAPDGNPRIKPVAPVVTRPLALDADSPARTSMSEQHAAINATKTTLESGPPAGSSKEVDLPVVQVDSPVPSPCTNVTSGSNRRRSLSSLAASQESLRSDELDGEPRRIRRMTGISDAAAAEIRDRIRRIGMSSTGVPGITVEAVEDDENSGALRDMVSPGRSAITEGVAKSTAAFWESAAAPPITMEEEKYRSDVRRAKTLSSSEKLNQRRNSWHMAAIVVQEARRMSQSTARRLSQSRPPPSIPVAVNAEQTDDTAVLASQAGSDGDQIPSEIPVKSADSSPIAVSPVQPCGDLAVLGAGHAVARFDIDVLERFVKLENDTDAMVENEVLAEHVQMFREAVFLQRDFLRLVCQVDENHKERIRILEESEEHIETAQAFAQGLDKSSQTYPHSMALSDAAEALVWIMREEDDGPQDEYVQEVIVRVRERLPSMVAANISGGENWGQDLLTILEGIYNIVRDCHAPQIQWGKHVPISDTAEREFPPFAPEVSQEHCRRLEAERMAFNARLSKLRQGQPSAAEPQFMYTCVRSLGSGAFGQVTLVRDGLGALYALKTMEKSSIIDSLQVEHALNERNVLYCIDCRHIVRLHAHHQDIMNVYLVLQYAEGGELLNAMKRQKSGFFTSEQCCYAVAQMALALEYLHNLQIVYRDLKPENVLLDKSGNLQLTDFGFAKRIFNVTTFTMCGTPEYMAPELIVNKGHTLAVDWWALGIFLFEIRSGYTPFRSNSEYETYFKISCRDFKYPSYPEFTREEKSFIDALLQIEVCQRLGNGNSGILAALKHDYFSRFDMDKMRDLSLESPLLGAVQLVDSGGDSGGAAEHDTELSTVETVTEGEDLYANIFSSF